MWGGLVAVGLSYGFIACSFLLKLGWKPVRTVVCHRVGRASCSCLNFGELWFLIRYKAKLTSATKSVLFLLKLSKHCSQFFMWVRFWSAVSKSSTHLAQSFFISNPSCKIYPTHSFEMPIVSAVSLTFICRSSNTISCTCSMISGVVALFGCPSCGSSSRLEQPHLNPAAHFLIVENEGEESP